MSDNENSMFDEMRMHQQLCNKMDSLLGSHNATDMAYLNYDLCKLVYVFHPLGKRIVDLPIDLSSGQERVISVKHPSKSEELIAEFNRVWKNYNFKNIIKRLAKTSRIYGIGALFLKVEGYDDTEPLPSDLNWTDITFTPFVYDALNISGSATNNQDLTKVNFLKVEDVFRSGEKLARDRSYVLNNGDPIYNQFSSSSLGFAGRSIYQNCITELRTWLDIAMADAMVARKCGLIIAKETYGGSATELQRKSLETKRQLLKMGRTNDVLSVGSDVDIKTLDLQNIDRSLDVARNHTIENIANATDIPTIILGQQKFTQGFGEGSEDTKNIGRFIDSVREWEQGVYQFIDNFVMKVAWNFDFLKSLNQQNGDIFNKKGDITYEQYLSTFQKLKNSFSYSFPSYLTETESEIAEGDAKRMQIFNDVYDRLLPLLDVDGKAKVTSWYIDGFNSLKSNSQIKMVYDEPDLQKNIIDDESPMIDGTS